MAIQGKPGMYKTEREEILARLESSPIEFFLHGSQYHRSATPSSDWDFFSEDNYRTRMFLTEKGFKEHFAYGDFGYVDCLTEVVMRHHSGVDVSLVRAQNLPLKKQMRAIDAVLRRFVTRKGERFSCYRSLAEALSDHDNELRKHIMERW